MKIVDMIVNRETRLKILQFLKFIPDKVMIKLEYRLKIGKKLDLNNPITFNEKLQWLKLYDRNPKYTIMVDKFAVREYIEKKIGKEYLVPIYGWWDSVEKIDFEKLPESFVLKCTHDSGSVILCLNKSKIDIPKVKSKLKRRLENNSFWYGREWPYKNIEPKIIAEEYLKDQNYSYLPVYKFFCFNGVPKVIQAIKNDKQFDETIDYFDAKWTKLNIKQRFPNSEIPLEKPKKLDEMLNIASKLSKDIKFLRVDLYIINDKIYFSENTFYPDAGYSKFEPEYWDNKFGKWLKLN